MPKPATEQLLELIKSLTKAEKRNFRLFVGRNNTNSELRFFKLYEYLDKTKAYDEAKLLKKIPEIKQAQLSNIKANLFRQLLASLRQVERNNQLDIAIRDQLDYARILYSKGLYKSSLSMLDKTKKQAWNNGFFSSALSALEFEKFIEIQYVTGSKYPKAEEITKQTVQLMSNLDLTHQLSNLSLSMYARYLELGHVKHGPQFDELTEFIKERLPDVEFKDLDFYQKLYFSQSHISYYMMIQDFPNHYKHAHRWINLFDEYPDKKATESTLYIKSLHNLLNALYMNVATDKFLHNYQLLNNFNADNKLKLNRNDKGQLILYQSIHTIHKIYLTAKYTDSIDQVKPIEELLDQNPYKWDIHRVMVLHYKIACVYFGAQQQDVAIDILNKVINKNYIDLRLDIQCYARILSLAAHFDMGNDLLVSYQVKSVYRFLLKNNQEQKVLKAVFAFLRRTPNMLKSELNEEFVKLRDKLIPLENDIYERRPFIYFDIISWLQSKINKSTIEIEIQEKM